MQQVADKMNFQDPVQKYAESHSWDMNNSNATKYHEIKVGILDDTCFKENVPTFEILVGWILRLGLNFWVINVALYGWKCDPAYLRKIKTCLILKIIGQFLCLRLIIKLLQKLWLTVWRIVLILWSTLTNLAFWKEEILVTMLGYFWMLSNTLILIRDWLNSRIRLRSRGAKSPYTVI